MGANTLTAILRFLITITSNSCFFFSIAHLSNVSSLLPSSKKKKKYESVYDWKFCLLSVQLRRPSFTESVAQNGASGVVASYSA